MNTAIRNKQEIYDNAASAWWSDDIRWVRTLKNLVPARMSFFDRFTKWTEHDVLDLGCAGGFMAEALAERGARVCAIDPAKDAVAAAIAHAEENGLLIKYQHGVGEALPYPSESFDRVVCVDVLEHVSDLTKVLAEITRVLRPGGLFLFDTINRNWVARLATIAIAEDVLRLLPKGTHDPDLFIRPSELALGMERAGLVAGPMTGLGPRGLTRRGDFTFGTLPFKHVIYAGVARKPAYHLRGKT